MDKQEAWHPLSTAHFADVLSHLQGALIGFVCGLVGDLDQARDIVQDTFVDAWRTTQRGSTPFIEGADDGDLRRWLFQVAYHRAISVLRRRRLLAWESLDLLYPNEPDCFFDSAPFEDQVAEGEAVRTALANLGPKVRRVPSAQCRTRVHCCGDRQHARHRARGRQKAHRARQTTATRQLLQSRDLGNGRLWKGGAAAMTSDNTPTTQPVPTPFCLLYAPLLPLLDGDLLDRGQASEVRGHVHTCAWCQAQLATYAVVDTVLRRHYGVTPSRGSATHDARAIPERAITLADVQRTSRRNARAATFLFLSTPMRQASRNQLNISPVPLDSLGAIVATVLVAVLLSLFIRVRLTQTSVSRETPRQLVPSCQVVQGKSLCEFALPTPNLQPSAIVLGTDGAMWFIEQVQNGPEKIGRLTPRGGFTEFSLPTVGGAVRDLTVGPDGAIWFTEQSSGGASIGRISSSGRITTFAFPISGIYANSITAGPDGALWFTEQGNINMRGSNKVGRITTTGHITEFSVTQQDMPIAITAGSGAWLWYLWFNGQGSFVTRITPTGTVLSNVMLSTTVLPVGGMTSGSDGNLWITDSQNDAILRITPAGTVSRFVVPPRSGLASIVAGPDGAIWFTEQLSNVVGRIVPSGAITTYPIRTANSGALGIARGANNSIWFTELSGNAIGRLV